MLKIVLIVLCVLLLVGMVVLDLVISRSMNRSDKNDDEK